MTGRARAPQRRHVEIGSTCWLTIDYAEARVQPVELDLLRTRAGACYLIEEIRYVRGHAAKLRMRCTRLGYEAVAEGAEGVFGVYWTDRS